MKKIFTEQEVSLETIQTHFIDSGFNTEHHDEDSFGARSKNGLYIQVRIDEEKQYIGFYCYFNLDHTRSQLDKLLLIQKLNYTFFLVSYSLERDDKKLAATYFMSYESGLIAGQLMHVFQRYSRLLDHIIEHENNDHMIVFGRQDSSVESMNARNSSVHENTLTLPSPINEQ